MVKLIAIHKMPEDPEFYYNYYMTTHLPLALKVPGLRKFEISQGDVVTVEGALDVLLVCTLYFDDFAALDAAMRTPEFAAVRDDGPKFAKPGNIDAFVLEDAAVLIFFRLRHSEAQALERDSIRRNRIQC